MEEFVAYRAETDRRFAELAEAQRRTEGHFEQPAEAQRRTSLSPEAPGWGTLVGSFRRTGSENLPIRRARQLRKPRPPVVIDRFLLVAVGLREDPF